MARLDYRRRAFYYLAQANAAADPERRVELLLLARMWMELFEPPEDIPGHFELPKHKSDEP
jgi:hypothetical protein